MTTFTTLYFLYLAMSKYEIQNTHAKVAKSGRVLKYLPGSPVQSDESRMHSREVTMIKAMLYDKTTAMMTRDAR